jgi:hypothetical protein
MQLYALSDYVFRETRWSADCEKPAFPRAAMIAFHARIIVLRRDCTVLPVAFAHYHATKNSFTHWGSFEGRNFVFMAHHALSSPQFQSSLSLIVLSLFMSHGTLQNCIVAKLWIVRARCFYFISAAVYNWFSVFHACRFYHSAKPFLFRSQFLVSSSPEPADPDESLRVFAVRSRIFLYWPLLPWICCSPMVIWPFRRHFSPSSRIISRHLFPPSSGNPGNFPRFSLFSPFDKGHSGVWLESRPRGPKSLTTLPRDRLIFHFIFSLHSAILRLGYKSTVSVTLTTGGDVGLRPDAGPDLTEAVESA